MVDLEISFDSDEQLSTIEVNVSGPETATLTESDFSESGSGPYTYTATYAASIDGDYTANVAVAKDAAGNDANAISETIVVHNAGSTRFGGGTLADFEDGDLSVELTSFADWVGEWKNDVGSGTIVGERFTIVSADPITGSFSANLKCDNDDPRAKLLSSNGEEYQPETVEVDYIIDNQTGNSNDGTKFELWDGPDLQLQVGFESGNGGTIEAENTDTGFNWNAGELYHVKYHNFDWSNGTADMTVNGTVMATGLNMRTSSSPYTITGVGVRTHTNSSTGAGSGEVVNVKCDDILMTGVSQTSP